MFSKKQCIESMSHEIRIIRHLAKKVPEGRMDWRPSPVQRSVRELLQYLSVCALLPAAFIRDGKWDAVPAIEEEAAKLDPKDFDEAMAKEEKALIAFVEGFSDAEMAERPTAMPWGTPCVTGQGIVDMCLKTLVAYRMQLFLYAKQSGNHDLGPANCWIGNDRPKPKG